MHDTMPLFKMAALYGTRVSISEVTQMYRRTLLFYRSSP